MAFQGAQYSTLQWQILASFATNHRRGFFWGFFAPDFPSIHYRIRHCSRNAVAAAPQYPGKPLFYKGFFLFPTVFFPRGAYARALASPRGAVSRHPSAAPRHSVPLRVIGSCHARAQHSG
ncbi:hypothetical protein BOC59_05725 [Burkholderia pseudomallei]|nr:hypothetical protein BOC59_05725 [Burkholderia pseudomallei]